MGHDLEAFLKLAEVFEASLPPSEVEPHLRHFSFSTAAPLGIDLESLDDGSGIFVKVNLFC